MNVLMSKKQKNFLIMSFLHEARLAAVLGLC